MYVFVSSPSPDCGEKGKESTDGGTGLKAMHTHTQTQICEIMDIF